MKRTTKITDWAGMLSDMKRTKLLFAEDLLKRLNPLFPNGIYFEVRGEATGLLHPDINRIEAILELSNYPPRYKLKFKIPNDGECAKKFRSNYDFILRAIGNVADKYAMCSTPERLEKMFYWKKTEFVDNTLEQDICGKTFSFDIFPDNELYRK